MYKHRNRLYLTIGAACGVGYVWLCLNLFSGIMPLGHVSICLIKRITNIPCPSCGTTRSVLSLAEGHFANALAINHMGFIVALIMLVAPVWIMIDIVRKDNSLLIFYSKIETNLRKPPYAILAILLVLSNWIWNIVKGL